MSWFVLLALACGGPAAAAVAITGDIRIDPPASTLRRGDIATITYTITNTGDEAIDFASAGTTYRQFGPMSTVFPFATTATPPCTFQLLDGSPPPGQPAIVVNTVGFRPAVTPPGESRQCVTGLQVSPDTAGPFEQSFIIAGTRNAQTVYIQRVVSFGLGVNASVVPALSTWGMTLLAALLLVFGHRRFQSSCAP